MSRTKRAFNGFLTGLFGFGVQIALQVVMIPYIIKLSGKETLGSYSIIMQIIGYGLLFDLGFSVALGRFLSNSFGYEDNGRRFSDILNIGRTFLLIINLFIGILIFTSTIFIQNFISANEFTIYQMQNCMILLGVWTILKTPLTLFSVALNSSQNMSKVNLISIVSGFTRFALSLLLIKLGMGLMGMVIAFIIADLLSLMLNRYYFLKIFKNYNAKWKITDKDLFKEIFEFGLRYWGVNFAVVIFYSTDSILVGHLFGATAASIYYVTKTPSFFAYQLIFRITDNIGPATNELFAKSEFESIRSTYFKLLKYSLIFSIPLALGIIIFNKYIISIWAGVDHFGGDLMTYAMACYVIIEVINHINAMIVLVSGKMNGWTSISIIQSILGITLAYLLGKLYGLGGVMLGLVISSSPMFIFLFYKTLPVINIKLNKIWQNILLPLLLANLPLIFFVVLIKIGSFSSFYGFAIIYYIIAFIFIWGLSVFLLLINKEEKIWVKILLKNISIKFLKI